MRKRNNLIAGLENAPDIREQLIRQGATFQYYETSYTAGIDFGTHKYFIYDDLLSMPDLGLMAKLKKEITENSYRVKFQNKPGKIKYIVYNYERLQNDTDIFDVHEIDITGAYFQAAHKMKLISNKLFKQLLKKDKMKRLKILGSIATQRQISNYKNGKLIKAGALQERVKENPELRRIWFAISFEIDNLLMQCYELSDDKILFYYVDGIYTDCIKTKELIEAKFKEFNYKTKYKAIEYLRVTREGNLILKEKDKTRIFFVRKPEIRKFIYI